MYWYESQESFHPVILSTRVRLARNRKGIPFPETANAAAREQVCQTAREAFADYSRFEFEKLSDYEKNAYVEAHLCSPQFAKGEQKGKELFVSADGAISVMVNEEDHYRIQAICKGFEPQKAFALANGADDALLAKAEIAFSEKLGFLTACPTNLGCALRISAMLHLPALSHAGEMGALARAADRLGFTLRGAFGEGSEAQGHLYQISNKSSCRQSEEEILAEFERVITEISRREERKRAEWQQRDPDALEDGIFRSLGILSHARVMDYGEFVSRWSDLRLGLALKLATGAEEKNWDRLLVELMPARLCLEDMSASDPHARDLLRAKKLRRVLGAKEE